MLSAGARLCGLVWLALTGFALGAAAQQPAGVDPVAILKRENGVREKTNRNDHPRIALYNTTYHKLARNSPYCGTAVEWAIKTAGWELLIEYAPLARNWSLKKQYIVWSRATGPMAGKNGRLLKPQRNDVVVFCTLVNGVLRWHVGLLEDWQEGNSYCKTVEGNTSDRGVANLKKPSGQEGVYDEKIRSKNGIYCVVRPYRS